MHSFAAMCHSDVNSNFKKKTKSVLSLFLLAIPSRNSFTQQMRRNALISKKLTQTKNWRKAKHRRSEKKQFSPSSAKQDWSVLSSQIKLKELRIRVQRHTVDFLLHCKDPKSKERALLLILEEVKPKDNHTKLDSINDTQASNEKANSSVSVRTLGEVNLKPFTLDSSGSSQDNGSTVTAISVSPLTVVDTPVVRPKMTTRTRSMIQNSCRIETGLGNTKDQVPVCPPKDIDKINKANVHKQKKMDNVTKTQSVSVDDHSTGSSTGSHTINETCTAVKDHRPPRPVTQQIEQKATRSVSLANKTVQTNQHTGEVMGVLQSLPDKLVKNVGGKLPTLRKYVTVNLTRVKLPPSIEVEKDSDENESLMEKGKIRTPPSDRILRIRPTTLTAQADAVVSVQKRGPEQTQAVSSEVSTTDGKRGQKEKTVCSEVSTTEGKRGVREMTEKAVNSEVSTTDGKRGVREKAVNSDVSTAAGKRGVREMYFKPIDNVDLRNRWAPEPVKGPPCREEMADDKVIAIQQASRKEEGQVEKDVVENGSEELVKTIDSSKISVVEANSKSIQREGEESESNTEASGGEKINTHIRNYNTNSSGTTCKATDEKERVTSSQIVVDAIKMSASWEKQDIAIKQARVLLTDILKKVRSDKDKKSEVGIVRTEIPTSIHKGHGDVTQNIEISDQEPCKLQGDRDSRTVQKRHLRNLRTRPKQLVTTSENKEKADKLPNKEDDAKNELEVNQDSLQRLLKKKKN